MNARLLGRPGVAINYWGYSRFVKLIPSETADTSASVVARDGVIELAVADAPARIEDHGGGPVTVTDRPMKPLTVEDVRAAIDRVRP